MKHFISERFAINGLLIILSLFALLHVSVLLHIIPYEIVWGGRIKNNAEMVTFETVSLLMNLVMLALVGMHAGFIKVGISQIILQVAFWLMAGMFLLNTIGNLFSNNAFEKIAFTPLTLILLLLSLRLALSKSGKRA